MQLHFIRISALFNSVFGEKCQLIVPLSQAWGAQALYMVVEAEAVAHQVLASKRYYWLLCCSHYWPFGVIQAWEANPSTNSP